MSRALPLALVLIGCSGEVTYTPSSLEICDPARIVGDACAGPSGYHDCHDEAWLDGVNCVGVRTVADDAALQSNLPAAGPGECIDLAPGSYGSVALPPEVSLLGRGH